MDEPKTIIKNIDYAIQCFYAKSGESGSKDHVTEIKQKLEDTSETSDASV